MSKYNNIKSIPIESIPKEEIKIAIKEWAEGNKSLENLLWLCYEKNLKTSGSHAGARPFIDFKYQEGLNNFKRREIIKLCDVVVDGRYIDGQKDITKKWAGSKNQRVIDVKQSLAQNKIILYCD